jgi:hypothetical protein
MEKLGSFFLWTPLTPLSDFELFSLRFDMDCSLSFVTYLLILLISLSCMIAAFISIICLYFIFIMAISLVSLACSSFKELRRDLFFLKLIGAGNLNLKELRELPDGYKIDLELL